MGATCQTPDQLSFQQSHPKRMKSSSLAGIFLSRKRFLGMAEQSKVGAGRQETTGENITTGRRRSEPPRYLAIVPKNIIKKSYCVVFFPLKMNLQGERRKGCRSQTCFPADPNTPGWRDQGPGGELRSAAGGSVFPRFPRLLPLALRGRDRAAAGGYRDMLPRVTFPGPEKK